jgi:hypothetical protein
MHTKFWLEYPSERSLLEDPDICDRVLLKWMLKKWDVTLWAGFIWLRIGSNDAIFWHDIAPSGSVRCRVFLKWAIKKSLPYEISSDTMRVPWSSVGVRTTYVQMWEHVLVGSIQATWYYVSVIASLFTFFLVCCPKTSFGLVAIIF